MISLLSSSTVSFPGRFFMVSLIWTVVVVLFVLWLLGFSLHVAGALIHLLLILAIIGIVYNLLVGRRAV
jgi:hypothetical protein